MANLSNMAEMVSAMRPKECPLDLEIRKRADVDEGSFNGVQGTN